MWFGVDGEVFGVVVGDGDGSFLVVGVVVVISGRIVFEFDDGGVVVDGDVGCVGVI